MFFFAELPTEGFNILDFKNNFINWLLLVGLVVWLWNKYTPPMFQSRKENIENQLREAELARQNAERFLKEQQERVANAEAEAEKILADAKHLAEQLKLQVEEQTTKEIADLKIKLENSIANERQMAVIEMRSAAAKASIELTKQILPGLMTANVKANLLTQFIEELDETTSKDGWAESKN